MYRPFYPGAPRDIDEAARRIHRLLVRDETARADVAGSTASTSTTDPLAGWPHSGPILDGITVRNDARGRGAYGAGRTDHPHYGVDFSAPAGTTVYAPIDGTISHIGWAYEGDTNHPAGRRTIHVRGPDGHTFKLFYVAPIDGLEVGQEISAGAEGGTAQDWQSSDDTIKGRKVPTPQKNRVTDHVHVEVFDPIGERVDPSPWFDRWHTQAEHRRRLRRIEERDSR